MLPDRFSPYRCLLHLYPATHRDEFGEEMLAVFHGAQADIAQQGMVRRAAFYARETYGLLTGALEEHVRSITGLRSWDINSSRRFTMRSEFRFPKSTPILMTIILAAVVLAIEKATAIRYSAFPDFNQHVGPIRPEHFTFFPKLLLAFAVTYVAGVVGWGILYALHRSGLHRMTEMPGLKQE